MELGMLILIPIIGAVIGWVTNILAIRMIFHPRDPISVPGVRWKIHGLLPKRKAELARSVGRTVSQELLPMEHILDRIDQNQYKSEILSSVVSHVSERLEGALPRLIPSNLRHLLQDLVSDLVAREGSDLLDRAFDTVKSKIEEEIDISQIVEDQILSLDMIRLEDLVLGIAKTELRHIEILGAVLGFIIGVFQAILVWLAT